MQEASYSLMVSIAVAVVWISKCSLGLEPQSNLGSFCYRSMPVMRIMLGNGLWHIEL